MNHGGERFFGHAVRLEEAAKVGALPQLGDAKLDRSGAGLLVALVMAVALRQTLRFLLAEAGSRPRRRAFRQEMSLTRPARPARLLFSDDGETYFSAIKPLIVNGIEDVVTRPDLADRAIFLTLTAIPEEEKIHFEVLDAQLEACRSEALGALLDLMAVALARLPTLAPARLPRMAGFAMIGIAIEEAFGPPGCFMATYDSNRADSAASLADSDPLIGAVTRLVASQAAWRGNAPTSRVRLRPASFR